MLVLSNMEEAEEKECHVDAQASVRRKSVENEELDSPTILKLIRELDNDLLETTSKVTTRN